MTEDESFWFMVIDGEQRGPLTKAQILESLMEGELGGNDFIWRPGFTDWKAINETTDFWKPPSQIPTRTVDRSIPEQTPGKDAKKRQAPQSMRNGALGEAPILGCSSVPACWFLP